MEWLTDNIGTIVVVLLLLTVVAVILRYMYKRRKAGKSSCGCDCGSCRFGENCGKR